MSLATLKDKVEQLIEKAQSGGGGLPDWDDDSPVVCSGTCYANNNAHWEITEKGTFRVIGSGSGLICNGNQVSVVMSICPDIIPFLSKVRQAYVSDGITQAEVIFMPNCERVRLPDTLTKRTNMVGLASLKELDLSADINATLFDYIYMRMFALEKVTLSPLTTTIASYSFNSCYSLKEINLENVTSFKNACFIEAFSLSQPIVFNAGVTNIDGQAFYRTGLTSITFQTPTTGAYPTIAKDAFGQCFLLKNIYVPWAEGAVANAPWGATNAKIWYGVAYVENGIPYDKDGNPIEQEV
jgi:hypothetical protein